MADGFTESVTIDEGYTGDIRTQMHFESDGGIVVQKTFDAAPHLKYAEEARIATQGMNWGDGRFIGHIPSLHFAEIAKLPSPQEREKAITLYFQERPKLIMFDKYKA